MTTLTPRQREVVAQLELCRGSRKCIATRLGISKSRVDKCLAVAFEVYGVDCWFDLVVAIDAERALQRTTTCASTQVASSAMAASPHHPKPGVRASDGARTRLLLV